jgi:DNA-binding NarL/FixJ family response regulator
MSTSWSLPRRPEDKRPLPKVPTGPAPLRDDKWRKEDSGRPIRVLIADDHELVRRGLCSLFATAPGSFEVCAEAASGREAVQLARELHPDVVVIDVSMPGLNGLETTRLIMKEVPGAAVLILTMHESEQLIEELLNSGARGYVLKSDAARDLPVAVESLYRGRPFFSSKVAQTVLAGYLKDSERGTEKSPLTPAERRVVQLLAEGKSNKEVANLQSISVKTAETHRANIMRKLGLRSMSDLVHYAIRNNIIEA